MSFRMLAASAGFAGMLAAVPAAGQDLLCCGMMIPFKGSWTGMSSNCSKELEEATKEQVEQVCQVLDKLDKLCEDAKNFCAICDQARLERLRGRMGGLNEARAAHQKSAYDSQQKRNEARDLLWGKGEGLRFEGGSISAFGKAALDSLLLATGGGGKVGKAYSKVTGEYEKVKGWAQTGWNLGTDPGAVENWGKFGEKMLKEQGKAVFKARSAEALREAREYFEKTGNFAGAQNAYRGKWGGYGKLKDFKSKGDDLAGALDTLGTLYEAGDKVANHLQNWIDAAGDNERAKRDMGRVQAEVDRVQAEINRIMAACGQEPAAALPELLRASGGATKPPTDDAARRLRQAQQALAALRAFQRALAEADARLGAQIVAPFSPWFAGTWREAHPRLLLELVKASRPALEEFGRRLAELEKRAALARERLLAIPPDRGP